MYILADLRLSALIGTCKDSSRLKVGHLDLLVADIGRTLRFYRDVLGFSVIYSAPSIGHPPISLGPDEKHYFDLTWFYTEDDNARHHRARHLNHIAIVYPNEELLANAVIRLLNSGDAIDDARSHGGILSIYLRDPDANGLELYYDDGPRTQQLDPTDQMAIDSEPFDLEKWLEGVWAGSAQLAQHGAETLVGSPSSNCDY